MRGPAAGAGYPAARATPLAAVPRPQRYHQHGSSKPCGTKAAHWTEDLVGAHAPPSLVLRRWNNTRVTKADVCGDFARIPYSECSTLLEIPKPLSPFRVVKPVEPNPLAVFNARARVVTPYRLGLTGLTIIDIITLFVFFAVSPG